MAKNKINYSIIIPNYNGQKFLSDCLDSLFKSISESPNSDFEIILVDNGSKDDSVHLFEDFFKQHQLSHLTTEIYQLESNMGFALAVNIGIKKAKYEYVALLNNDLTMNSDTFKLFNQAISNSFSDPKTVVFTGTVLNKPGTHFESQGLKYNWIGQCQNISNGLPFLKSDIYNLTPDFIWGASAAFTVYHKQTLLSIGAFDDDFFAYEEDVDLALRLHLLGYKTLYIPQIISYHLGGGTSSTMGNFRSRHDFKNWIYIIIKNYSSDQIQKNSSQIFIERLRNLSGLIKSTLHSYSYKSIYILPKDLLLTFFQILTTLPKMFQKRKLFFALLKLEQQ